MPVPLAIAAGLAKVAGPLIGSYGNIQNITEGMGAYRDASGAGSDVLRAGQAGSNAAYQPYTSVGADAIGRQANAIYGRQQAANPTLSNTNPNDVSKWLDPSMQFSIDQANKAMQGKGIAMGGAGGGLAKAVSNNANQMAQTGWQNAFKSMIDANTQNFGQGQQLYANNNAFQQSQIDNMGGLAAQGLNATNANQGNQLAYNQGINSNWQGVAANEQAGWNKKGGIFDSAASGAGEGIGGLTKLFGGQS